MCVCVSVCVCVCVKRERVRDCNKTAVRATTTHLPPLVEGSQGARQRRTLHCLGWEPLLLPPGLGADQGGHH